MSIGKDGNLKPETFRDRMATVDEKGNRKWVFPKMPKGKLTSYRNWLSYLNLIILFGLPWVTYKGHPFVLLNIIERKFILFGHIFWPQDFYIIVFLLITAIVALIFFTVLFGRIFCGWACPQTIFMEMLYRKVEYLIEGDYTKQKKLDKQVWNREKIVKKGLKHFIFIAISWATSNTLLAYIIGTDQLIAIITEPVSEHAVGFTAMMIFGGVFYYIFAFFREQVCTWACPYGRLQGVLLDNQSVVVAYDFVRGEDRGKLRKGEDRELNKLGDCIDCKQCVHVCPTGIDIREGTQLECINCTACIDACDEMMIKIGKEPRLVGFSSMEGIEHRKNFKWTTRSIAYMIVLIGMIVLGAFMFFGRSSVDTTILRAQGTLFTEVKPEIYRNIYNVKLINKTFDDMPITVQMIEPKGEVTIIGGELFVASDKLEESVMFVDIAKENLDGRNTKIKIGIFVNGNLIETVRTKFLGPIVYN